MGYPGTKSQQRLRGVGLLVAMVGQLINLFWPSNLHKGNAVHFLIGLLLGLGITLIIGPFVARKNKCGPEESNG